MSFSFVLQQPILLELKLYFYVNSYFSFGVSKYGILFQFYYLLTDIRKKAGRRMQKDSIALLKQLFEEDKLTEQKIAEMRQDERKGVQTLLKRYDVKQDRMKALEQQFLAMSEFELKLRNNGYVNIAGVDEVGRGPLAGPVVAAAVVLPQNFKLLGLNDSKQLSESTREAYYEVIRDNAISYGIGIIHNDVIDSVNIYEATKLAMNEAINQLDPIADFVLVDAVPLKGLSCPSEPIIKGDSKSISIAAASILAKVTRDRFMKEIHMSYPAYDFASNMGYGTKHHMETLSNQGATPYHRRSFAPVGNVEVK